MRGRKFLVSPTTEWYCIIWRDYGRRRMMLIHTSGLVEDLLPQLD